MTRHRECCCPCPDSQLDGFGRDPGTNINASWVEEVGDWSLLDNSLRAPSDANALVLWQTPPGGYKISFRVRIESAFEADNDVLRVVVNAVDKLNYFFAEWKVNASAGYLSLNVMTAGSASEIATVPIPVPPDSGGGMGLLVCFTPRVFYAGLDGRADKEIWYGYPDAYADGFLAGIGANGDRPRYAGFRWFEHFYSNTNCPKCVCYCGVWPLPMALGITLNLSLAAGGGPDNPDQKLIDCIDGASTTLNYQFGAREWSGTITAGNPDDPDDPCLQCSELNDTYECNLTLSCTPGDDPDGGFHLSAGDNGSFFESGSMYNLGDSDGGTCFPGSLTFAGHIGPQCEADVPPSGSAGIDFIYTITW